MSNEKKICGFCGKTEGAMIRGVSSFICFDCLGICNEKIKGVKSKGKQLKLIANLKPSAIKNMLNEYVIDQDIAKEKLAVAIYNHYKMNKYFDEHDGNPPIEIEKSNVILLGPTGSGKTHIVKTLAKELGIPLGIADATGLTEAGYVGEDVENCIRKLIENADGDVEKAARGIIYIDEIDKICRKGENVSVSRDVSGEGVQQALLKLVEGTIAEVPPKGGRKHPDQECIKIDTSRILFIVGGSFEGIEKTIAKRKQGKSTMGFGSKIVDTKKAEFNEYIHDVVVDDIKKFGMLPEFLGRFPVIATLNELNEEALIKILTEPKNSLVKQYTELLKMDSIDLIIEPGALAAIAHKAIERKTGARSLRAIVDEKLLDYMYKLPDDELADTITITKEVIEENAEAVITHREPTPEEEIEQIAE
jgi:ATP-dependent Clp protease ATP-binding subunit ClpX